MGRKIDVRKWCNGADYTRWACVYFRNHARLWFFSFGRFFSCWRCCHVAAGVVVRYFSCPSCSFMLMRRSEPRPIIIYIVLAINNDRRPVGIVSMGRLCAFSYLWPIYLRRGELHERSIKLQEAIPMGITVSSLFCVNEITEKNGHIVMANGLYLRSDKSMYTLIR